MLGETVGSYTILDKIGEGGMGAVYRGEHTQIGQEVAIKVLLPELAKSANIVQRFFNEAKATTAIKHPGIVEVYDVGNTRQGSPYIVMEFLRGEPLQTKLFNDKKLPPDMAVGLMKQIASALGAAHAEGIVHRDLKPDNIFLLPDPLVEFGLRVKLLDFGIAKLDEELRGGLDPTRAGAILGTPQYMSPEQCTGSTALDHRADIYALGCMLFHMLCGRPPFTETEFGKIAIKHLSAPPPKPSELEPAVSAELEQVVLKLLEKQPEDRYQSCGQVVDALEGKALRAATPVPVVLPPGARTFVPGQMADVDLSKLPAPKSKAQKEAEAKAAAQAGNTPAPTPGPTPSPTPGPTPAPTPTPAPGLPQRPDGPRGNVPTLGILVFAAVVIGAIVAAVVLTS